MILTLVVIVLVWLGLAALLFGGTFALQNYVNDSPPVVPELLWRSAAAAALATAFLLWLTHLSRNSPTVYAPPLDFAATEEDKPVSSLYAISGGKRTLYRQRKDSQGRDVYLDELGRELRGRPDAVFVVEEGGVEEIEEAGRKLQGTTFTAPRGKDGKFVTEAGQPLRYESEDGRYVQEGYFGRVSRFRSGRWFLYIVLNLLLLGAWWVCFWPLLRFPWAQSLLGAVVAYVITSFVLLPLFTRTPWFP